MSFLIAPPTFASSLPAPLVVWERTYSLGLESQARDIVLIGEGGYAIAGVTLVSDSSYNTTSYELTPQNSDAFLIRTDENGNELWARTFGGSASDGAYALGETRDGGFILAGYTSDPDHLDADRTLSGPIPPGMWYGRNTTIRTPGSMHFIQCAHFRTGISLLPARPTRARITGVEQDIWPKPTRMAGSCGKNCFRERMARGIPAE
ncbi:hypothetical protein [Methanolinea mesophila]|uniref:hypothetical protein n=1 Tax=Methanolinea mesophila TaxID=547055 RepID=UPI001AE1C76B|nr:hypothetical protein [Methanolinea mesophila]